MIAIVYFAHSKSIYLIFIVKKNHITILNEEASGQYVRYAKLNIDPDSPIKIQAGQKFSIDMEMEIIKAIPIGARLKLENPSIPCISSKVNEESLISNGIISNIEIWT